MKTSEYEKIMKVRWLFTLWIIYQHLAAGYYLVAMDKKWLTLFVVAMIAVFGGKMS